MDEATPVVGEEHTVGEETIDEHSAAEETDAMNEHILPSEIVDVSSAATLDDASAATSELVEGDAVSLALQSCASGHGTVIVNEFEHKNPANDWDDDSDEDSLLSRQRVRKQSAKEYNLLDWENLEDESTCCLQSTDDTASLSSYDSQSYVDLSAVATLGSRSVNSQSTSDCSQATIVTAPSTTPAESTAQTPNLADKETLEEITKATIGLKAVKADDAEVPVYLWDRRIVGDNPSERKQKALTGLRLFGLRLFRRGLFKDCIDRLERKFGRAWRLLPLRTPSGKLTPVAKEKEALRHILWHATEATWFEYLRGSRIHHFRFPFRYQRMARDGVPIFFETPGPSKMQRQPEFTDQTVKERVRPKIEKVINRRYLARVSSGLKLKSLIKYFAVPKGLDDIRIVYDGTASGLNDDVWAPPFWLATIESLIRALSDSSWMADRDIGDMFLSFALHPSAWPFAGVDIGPILWHWCRNAMGFSSSPYNSIKMSLIAEEVILGDRLDSENPF
jgi:hypothetical protein